LSRWCGRIDDGATDFERGTIGLTKRPVRSINNHTINLDLERPYSIGAANAIVVHIRYVEPKGAGVNSNCLYNNRIVGCDFACILTSKYASSSHVY
jgi:hypothetical protein